MKSLDIFGRIPGGKPIWIGSVDDLALAEERAMRFAERFNRETLVYSEREGLIVKRIDPAATTVGLSGHIRSAQEVKSNDSTTDTNRG